MSNFKVIITLFFVALLYGWLYQNNNHNCTLKNCPYQGKKHYNYSANSTTIFDNYLIDSLHFEHPDLPEGQLEVLFDDIQ